MLQVAHDRRQFGLGPAGTHESDRRLGLHVEVDEQLPGQQAACLQARAQAALDQGLEGVARGLLHALTAVEDPLGLEFDDHRDAEGAGTLLVFEAHADDRSHLDSLELHRRTDREAAHRILEEHHKADFLGKALLQDGLLVVMQREHESGDVIRAGFLPVGGVEGDPAEKQRLEGFGLDPHAVRADRQVEAACAPETRIAADHAVEWRFHEGVDQHAPVVVGHFVAEDFTRNNALEMDERPAVDRPEFPRHQGDLLARLIGIDHRR